MRNVQDLAVNILAALVVFALGASTQWAMSMVRSWRGRRFWGKRVMRNDTTIFLGSFTELNHLEPTGFVGLGDSRAVLELTAILAGYGVKAEIAFATRMRDGQHRDNIVLIGLDEVNSLVPRAFESIGTRFRVDTQAMTIEDQHTGEIYRPEWEECVLKDAPGRTFDDNWSFTTGPDGIEMMRRFRTDYGIFIRTSSPYARDRALFVIAGIYGFGTWAAARLPLDDAFLRLSAEHEDFECLFRTDVHQSQILATSIITMRALTT